MPWIEELALLRNEVESLRKATNGKSTNGHAPARHASKKDAARDAKNVKSLEAKIEELQAECVELKRAAKAYREQIVAESLAREEAEEEVAALESKLNHYRS